MAFRLDWGLGIEMGMSVDANSTVHVGWVESVRSVPSNSVGMTNWGGAGQNG